MSGTAEDRDLLAAEYVLGTLDARASAAVDARSRSTWYASEASRQPSPSRST
jgi:anti-sigma-K factor RskA